MHRILKKVILFFNLLKLKIYGPIKFINKVQIYKNTYSVYDAVKSKEEKVNNEAIASDIVSFLLVDSLLGWSDYIKKSNFDNIKFIDIGGEFGIHSILFKSIFPKSEIKVMEVRECKDDQVVNKIKKYLETYQNDLNLLINNKAFKIYSETYGLNKITFEKINNTFTKVINSDFNFLHPPLLSTESILKHEEKYDVIFSFSSADYFHPVDFFGTINRLLNKDGVAIIWMPSIVFYNNSLQLKLKDYYSIASKPFSYLIKEQIKLGGNVDGVIASLNFFYRGVGFFTFEDIMQIINQNNLKIINSSYHSVLSDSDYSIKNYNRTEILNEDKILKTIKSIKNNLKQNITTHELFSPYYYFLIKKI